MSARVCVVGAGCSGLTTAKRLKEFGVDYDHFELSDDAITWSGQYDGSWWRYYEGERLPDELIVPLHARNIALRPKAWQLSPTCRSSKSLGLADFSHFPDLARGLQC